MPHQCTNCGYAFPDGSKEMLSGCPECGGNKFQFHPKSIPTEEPTAEADSPPIERESPRESPPETEGSNAGRPAATSSSIGSQSDGSAVADARSQRSSESKSSPSLTGSRSESSAEIDPPGAVREDRAQATARTDVVSEDELSVARERARAATVEDPEESDRPDLSQLRDELNDQFESIRIVNPGEYELNLMELYDRQEYIISLREDGRYVIEVPDSWGRFGD
ncbi:Zn-ribbon domain-containing protein [Haloferacaceae archaeon DSL9]